MFHRKGTNIALVVLTIFSVSGLMNPMVSSSLMDDFDGSPDLDIIFGTAGDRTVDINVPGPSILQRAWINLTGAPNPEANDSYPSDVVLDVGGDGDPEWTFSGQGYGPLGHQDRFDDDTKVKEFDVNGPTSFSYDVLLPAVSFPEEAGIRITGVPSQTDTISETEVNISVDPQDTMDRIIGGMDSGRIVETANVTISDVVAMVPHKDVDQGQENDIEYLDLGYYAAQSFAVNRTDPKQQVVKLRAVEIFVSHVSPNQEHLGLRIYNASIGSDSMPTGSILSNTSLVKGQIPDGGYANFTFDPPVLLEPDEVYVMVLYEIFTMAMSGHYNAHYHQGFGGLNFNSNYAVEGCWMMVSIDYGQSWVPYKGRDLRFRTHIDKAVKPSQVDLNKIKVDDQGPDTITDDDLFFEMASPRYDDLGWNISVENGLSTEVLFDLTAKLDHHDLPSNIDLYIADDDVADFTHQGDLEGSTSVNALRGPIYGHLEAVRDEKGWSNTSDPHSMEMVLFKVTAEGNGSLRLDGLSIEYQKTALINLTQALDDLYGTQAIQPNDLSIPIKVSSSTPGRIVLSGLKVEYDSPPRLASPFPDLLTIPEEGVNRSLMDLDLFVKDDSDTELGYTIHNITTDSDHLVEVTIDNRHYLGVDASNAVNWTGSIKAFINASDTDHVSTIGPINLSVIDVNDPPVIVSTPTNLVYVGQTYSYEILFEDSDDTVHTCTLKHPPTGMTLHEANMTITWVPTPDQTGYANFTIELSDGELTHEQAVSILVRATDGPNLPPVLDKITDRTITVNEELEMKIGATDPEGDILTFELVEGPDGMMLDTTTGVLTWVPDLTGVFTVKVMVKDFALSANVSFNITVQEEGTIVLEILTPKKDDVIKHDLIITGNARITGSEITTVQYQIDGGAWMDADLEPGGSWSAEPDITSFKDGSHTVLVRAGSASGLTRQTYTTFVIVRPESKVDQGSFLTSLPFIFLLIALITALVAGVVIARIRKAKGPAKARPTTKAASTTTSKERGKVESAFLVYHDGRLITYSSRGEIEDLDGTLQIIKDFVKASFKGDVGRLDALRYEDMNIIIERGIQMYLVVITPMDDVKALRREMRRFLHDVHDRHKQVLKVWDGKFKRVKGIATMVERFVAGEWGSDEEALEEKKDKDKSERWDDSPDMDDQDTSKVEKLKELEDRMLRGEISEDEFDRLSKRLR